MWKRDRSFAAPITRKGQGESWIVKGESDLSLIKMFYKL